MKCEHLDFEARVDVYRITEGEDGPVSQFAADVVVTCKGCGEGFGFRGPPAGHSWNEPRCQIDAKKITLPLMSPAELELAGPLPAASRGPMVYEVYPSGAEAKPEKEYIVLHAAGWPGGYLPTPNTEESALAFQRKHGGEVRWRWTCDWQPVE